ncbi:T-cell leukemia/lymphoma protein 1A [Octodon degus]|uniref:T-cell leukemia/lymphoma protein 1A n=1 Tax=Octodon degus TaxID=10160 RepID=A0A6P3EZC9_OCTDE|nr:T-cell leukemia/lymphoma protein 1A [Octodon degus]
MAQSTIFNRQVKHITEHPSRLWIWDKATFMDEQRRTWLPVILKSETNMQVLLRQQTVPVGDPKSPTQLGPSLLPLMWQHYPSEKRYQDSNFASWHVMYHIKFCDMEDILLEKVADQEKVDDQKVPDPKKVSDPEKVPEQEVLQFHSAGPGPAVHACAVFILLTVPVCE